MAYSPNGGNRNFYGKIIPMSLLALRRLNQIGAAINRLGAEDLASIPTILASIVQSAVEVIPGSSAVIYSYQAGAFDLSSRVSTGPEAEEESADGIPLDAPRPDGMGMRAVIRQQRVLSYEEPDQDIHPNKAHAGARAMVCYPLVVSGESLGVLYLYLNEERHFGKLELLQLDNFVNQAALTLSLARQLALAQQEHLRKGRELRRLRRAGMLITSRRDLQETMQAILHMALEVIDAHYGIFSMLDAEGANLITSAFISGGLEIPTMDPIPVAETSVVGWVASRREPVVITDLRQPPWNEIYQPLMPGIEMRSEVAVPVLDGSGRLEGVLNLESPQVAAFNKEDRYLLQILAAQSVYAVQQMRLLDALQEISAMLLTQPLQPILDRIAETACILLDADMGQIWLLEKGSLILQASTPCLLCGERVMPIRDTLPLQDSLTGLAALLGQPVSSPDVRSDERYLRRGLAIEHEWGAALILPLFSTPDKTPIGAFSVYAGQHKGMRFAHDGWEEKVLTILGRYAMMALQNAAHNEALRSAQEKRLLAETFAAVGDVAANLMHRLNNKVGTIPVRVEGIYDKSGPALRKDPYLAQNLAEIGRSAEEAMSIVSDTLFHLRPVQLSAVNLAGCLEEAVAEVKLPANTLLADGIDGLPPVQADPQRLKLVFINLIDNAIEATHGAGIANPEIRLWGSQTPGWIEMRFTDNGPGIRSDLVERVFEFNFSAGRRPGKLGFGLWWVKTLMTRFGGNIWIEQAPDEENSAGHSIFVLQLPPADANKETGNG